MTADTGTSARSLGGTPNACLTWTMPTIVVEVASPSTGKREKPVAPRLFDDLGDRVVGAQRRPSAPAGS